MVLVTSLRSACCTDAQCRCESHHHHGNRCVHGQPQHPPPPGAARPTQSDIFEAAMVKLGANLSDKLDKQSSVDDGFDNIPLITPLEVNQLQETFTDKVIVKTSTQFQLQQKKRQLFMPNLKKLNINFYRDVSEKAKITGLILLTLGFLTSLLLLLMYKEMWYDQLTCPEGFILKGKHCSPAALEMYYTEQQTVDQSRDQSVLLSALNQVKRTSLQSPWKPVFSAPKEAHNTQALQYPMDQDK
uniref:Calcyon neuron-specific vesicular protein n=1 Tax=Knipowitschia caucasica TaxID=637954 RepID=A0AAV2LHE7_KNICA